jgi:hypothetical protein
MRGLGGLHTHNEGVNSRKVRDKRPHHVCSCELRTSPGCRSRRLWLRRPVSRGGKNTIVRAHGKGATTQLEHNVNLPATIATTRSRRTPTHTVPPHTDYTHSMLTLTYYTQYTHAHSQTNRPSMYPLFTSLAQIFAYVISPMGLAFGLISSSSYPYLGSSLFVFVLVLAILLSVVYCADKNMALWQFCVWTLAWVCLGVQGSKYLACLSQVCHSNTTQSSNSTQRECFPPPSGSCPSSSF